MVSAGVKTYVENVIRWPVAPGLILLQSAKPFASSSFLLHSPSFRIPIMTSLLSPSLLPIFLLVASNVFMTFAWYGHLKYPTAPLALVVFTSWGIALMEYWLAIPANRIGHTVYSTAELKTMQEVITLVVFSVFSVFYLKEAFTWQHVAGFALIAGGATLIFKA